MANADRPMPVTKALLMRTFGRPEGVLGWLGGMIMARTNRRMIGRAVELLDVRPSDHVLEVGFGPGVGIAYLARAVSSGHVAGVDPSELMLGQARSRNAAAVARGAVELRKGGVERLPFRNESFDRVMAINSMQLWPDAVNGLREIHRVLKPGGCLVLGFTRHSGQGREGVAEALEAAGFTDVRFDDVDARDFCVVASKRSKADG
ncbi:MAG TPA: class I SAM-dependent methyltransferase [Gammaproteobacteria bacterium]